MSTKNRPGRSPVITGGVSSAVNSLRFSFDLPMSMPMYAPEISVPRPLTLAPEMRGRTTQNCVSATRKLSVFGSICAVVITSMWSSDRRMAVIDPTSTPLN